MAYNVRIIEYPNGQMQIRYYSNPLNDGRTAFSDEFLDVFEVEPKKKKKNIKLLNPFDGSEVREVDSFEADEQRKMENKQRNANRAKQKLYTCARSNKWDWFLTWTFSPEKIADRYDYDLCFRKIRDWVKSQQKRNAPDLMYLIVPEQHEDGAWHFHGLLADCGKMKFADSGKKDKKRRKIYNLSGFRSGWTTATKVGSCEKAAAYLCKYMTKSLLIALDGRHRYLRSNNLQEPEQYTMLCDDADDFSAFLQTYCDSVGKKIAHVKNTGAKEAYTQVTYVELQ